jgi:hypothetical protein
VNSTFNAALRIPPPKCTIKHADRSTRTITACPTCVAWRRHVRALRRDAVKAGVPRTYAKPGEIVKASRCPHHGPHKPGCPSCQAWTRYQSALRRKATREGTLKKNVPAQQVIEYLKVLLDPTTGGWTIEEICRVTGLRRRGLSSIYNGHQKSVSHFNFSCLQALEPKGDAVARRTPFVEALEARRILRALTRQGWKMEHMASIVGTGSEAVSRVARSGEKWCMPSTLEKARLLRDKLGSYDISEMDSPLPGMSRYSANYGAKRGWAVLRDWEGLDIKDPACEPFRQESDPLAALAGNLGTSSLYLREQVAAASRSPFVQPIKSMTRIEAYLVAEESFRAGMSYREISVLLGYPRDSRDEYYGWKAARWIIRVISNARQWIESGSTETTWFSREMMSPDWSRLIVPLMFCMPRDSTAPFGYGRTLLELATRLDMPGAFERADRFLEVAFQLADAPWVPMAASEFRAADRKTIGFTKVRLFLNMKSVASSGADTP